MKDLIHFLLENKEWLFSGIGILIGGIAIKLLAYTIQKVERSNYQVIIDWIKVNAQWIFSGLGVALISIVIGLASNVYVDKVRRTDHKIPSKTFDEQINSLNDVESSLQELILFVNSQKSKLKESEEILNSLKNEHETLKPIVETEREVIKKIFALQSKMSSDAIWKERVVSFFLGVLASVIASFVYGLFQRFHRR